MSQISALLPLKKLTHYLNHKSASTLFSTETLKTALSACAKYLSQTCFNPYFAILQHLWVLGVDCQCFHFKMIRTFCFVVL